jgi:hypothetical protein
MSPLRATLKPWLGLSLSLCLLPSLLLAVKVEIAWEYKDLPAGMKIFELAAGKKAKLWDMGEAASLSALPVSSEIAASAFEAVPGSAKRFVLVYKNTTKKPLYFFAAPHNMAPAESSLGFKFKCLCTNHAYEVKPSNYWYRVVEMRVAKDVVGDSVKVTHTLISIDKARKEKFGQEDMGHSMDGF